jgi:predicted metalloprotease with PDZ domain
VLLQESGSGTLVTITQAGFGEGEDWQTQLDNVGLGWAQSLAGLELYLRTGVRFDRFFTFKSDLGVLAHEEMAGPCVASVTPESYAAQAGLEVGDIIVQVGSAPIFTRSDLWLFTREHEIGEDIEVKFVRGSELRHGRAQLTAPWPG